MNESKLLIGLLRGAVRKAFMRSKVRGEAMKKATSPYVGPNKRRKKQALCNLCKEHFKINEVQVDHINGEHSFKTIDEINGFIESIINVKVDDLQVLCKSCHKLKTLAERRGISIDDARIERKIIEFKKLSAAEQSVLMPGYKTIKDRANALRKSLVIGD